MCKCPTRAYFLLQVPGSANVIANDGSIAHVWSASFVGTGSGTASISAGTAECRSTDVLSASPTSLTLRWSECNVSFGSAKDANNGSVASAANVTWVEHKASNCAGEARGSFSPFTPDF